MGVEHVQAVIRANLEPVVEAINGTGEERVQQQWCGLEVVDQINQWGDVQLLGVVSMHLNQNTHAVAVNLLG